MMMMIIIFTSGAMTLKIKHARKNSQLKTAMNRGKRIQNLRINATTVANHYLNSNHPLQLKVRS